ncbi:MAG: NAD(P)/FAD-dependent oxidoreductase [Pseudomonadota bacterium]
MKRRQFLQATSAAIVTAGCATVAPKAKAHVVVIGGGYGGATAARYIRMWSEGGIDVTIVEPNPAFISCPLSNLVLGGSRQLGDLTMGYEALQKTHGVRIVRGVAESIDTARRSVKLAGGQALLYDRLVLSPGVDFVWDELPGAQDKVLHAWKAGQQTLDLRARLTALPDGGTFVMTIPPAPYRCPPGPYERACQVAHYFSVAKPKSKVLILDANDDVVSKGALFKRVWAQRYPGMIEYRPRFKAVEVDAASGTVVSELGDRVQAGLLNVIPPQRAGAIAVSSGLANVNQRWCGVNFLTFESTQAPNVHVLGDAIQTSPLMPKSAHMANQHAKVCAAAVVDMLAGREPNPMPMLTNTCYSFVSDKDVIHVASVHAYSAEQKTLLVVPGSGGVSTAASELEGAYAVNWARNIWADTLL